MMDSSKHPDDGFNDWEQIQSPSTTDFNINVAIKENYLQFDNENLSIFPPNNHEGLQVSSQEEEKEEDVQVPVEPTSPPPSSPSSASLCSAFSSNVTPAENSIFRKRSKLKYVEILKSWVFAVASKGRSFEVCRGGLRSFVTVIGVAAAVLVYLFYAKVQKWRLQIQERKNNRLMLLIKERDQKISQLLLQIAQLNESLSMRRKVPVIRVS